MNVVESLIDGVVDIRHHAFRTFMQAIGIVLGVTSVVATISLVDSSNQRTMAIYEELGSLKQIVIGKDWQAYYKLSAVQKAADPLDMRDIDAISRLDRYVESVEANFSRPMRVRQGKYDEIRGVEGAGTSLLRSRKLSLTKGRIINELDLRYRTTVAVLGHSIARKAYGSADPIGKTIYLGTKGFTVVGVLDEKIVQDGGHGNNFMDWLNWEIYVPITTLADVVFNTDEVDFIRVTIRDLTEYDVAKDAIDAVLKNRRKGSINYRFYSSKERIEQSKQERMALDVTLAGVGVVSLLVGGVVIMNILLASFNERVREVGIRKALGATWLDIIVQFIVESVVITVIGGILGIGVGAIVVYIITVVTKEPLWVTPNSIFLGFFFSVSVGIFFGFYPAFKAARLNPIEALRYE